MTSVSDNVLGILHASVPGPFSECRARVYVAAVAGPFWASSFPYLMLTLILDLRQGQDKQANAEE